MESQSVAIERIDDKQERLELGYVICRHCSKLIATLPTNRVKRFYGQCSEGCEESRAGLKEFD
ncbi:GapA-binding peptide SR1P [Paenibacillus sp. N4]|uniref:GapA-binding peptide SR1P n=1 Tax=Paenibacillus vietnamensis TaxID=2590547 RepID=UPI001CD147E7|nr:GapA-binding peptide SR1P [Paenibacillus vietnamensis]MCA0753579.1 GapA-binding peptide SR1P [Paenibacillus vietnamensis]